MDNETRNRIAKEVIDSLPEDSPLLPHIKDAGDIALACILMALFFMPPEEMKRIVQKAMKELQEDDDAE